MSDTRHGIYDALQECFDAQEKATADWHIAAPSEASMPGPRPGDSLTVLVLRQHLLNFLLWHTEDIARRRDVDDAVIADCKRRIDGYNQRRNDAMEQVDSYLVEGLRSAMPGLTVNERPRHNTESLGMAVDRLSILALKIYHMEEQVARDDADESHKASCAAKLAVLREQRSDLAQAVFDLVEDYLTGKKQPKAYYQFKMYNDPALNPELYARK